MADRTRVCALEDIHVLGARVVRDPFGDLSVFRNGEDEVFALHDRCPHKGGPLSQGIVHGRSVTCPLHNRKIDLACGGALAADEGCTRSFAVKVEAGVVHLQV